RFSGAWHDFPRRELAVPPPSESGRHYHHQGHRKGKGRHKGQGGARHRVCEPGWRDCRFGLGVIAPKEKVRRPKVYLPAVHFDDKETRFRDIMGRVKARNLASVATAIV